MCSALWERSSQAGSAGIVFAMVVQRRECWVQRRSRGYSIRQGTRSKNDDIVPRDCFLQQSLGPSAAEQNHRELSTRTHDPVMTEDLRPLISGETKIKYVALRDVRRSGSDREPE